MVILRLFITLYFFPPQPSFTSALTALLGGEGELFFLIIVKDSVTHKRHLRISLKIIPTEKVTSRFRCLIPQYSRDGSLPFYFAHIKSNK